MLSLIIKEKKKEIVSFAFTAKPNTLIVLALKNHYSVVISEDRP